MTIYLSGNVDEVVAFLEENGGDPRNVGEDYIEAYVPVLLLGPVSDRTGVIRVREIVPPEPGGGLAGHRLRDRAYLSIQLRNRQSRRRPCPERYIAGSWR